MTFRGQGRQRMPKRWMGMAATVQAMTTDATFALGGLAQLDVPFTVLRIIGEYTLGSTANITALESAQVGVGIGVVSVDAFALGGTAMPDPLDEPEYPWLYWGAHTLYYPATASPLSPTGDPRMSVRVPLDVRSMRKIKPQETLVVAVQYKDVVGAPGLRYQDAGFRTLVAT